MKSLLIKGFIVLSALIMTNSVMGQTADLTIEVKGIKEVKGKILVAIKDSEDPQKLIYDMVTVEKKEGVFCILKNVPIGKVDVSLFQDLNDNFKLDMDEQNTPVEPCYSKEKVKITENENKLVVKLINVKELISSQPK